MLQVTDDSAIRACFQEPALASVFPPIARQFDLRKRASWLDPDTDCGRSAPDYDAGSLFSGAASARLNLIVARIPSSGFDQISSSAPAFCFRD